MLYNTYYHIYNRGVNRENIFIEERNYQHFLNLYIKYIDPIAETYAYCLLRNHFHVLVKVKSEDEILLELRKTLRVSIANQSLLLQNNVARDQPGQPRKPLGSGYASKKFSDFFNAYAKSINKTYGRTGSLFQHPFGRVPVKYERQFWNVIAYIHQNPQKHKFVDDFRDWTYSSFGLVLSEKDTFLQRESILDWFGGKQQYRSLHEDWVTEAQSMWFVGEDND